MATVRDLWTKRNPNTESRTKRIHSERWGVGKRWQAVWIENGREATKSFATRDEAELWAARAEVGKQTAPGSPKTKQTSHSPTYGILGSPLKETSPTKPNATTSATGMSTSDHNGDKPPVHTFNARSSTPGYPRSRQ
ncbi:hypothetical protein [Corynebacterium silvaticum]|uniref:Uncharacterized protein n=1 Tax=Corynebacterium silvaticum TaxID=2320431 RepID=A0ACD4PYC9_9CORY|nr:hypothetical protein [Corynebacterium silvaticum]WCV10689.1 hypothetical protein CBE74_12095 [Corynebacterium silvaticum]